ncbi:MULTISPECIES: 1,4-dihydroxy-2-naphthoate polyprenyltransferase [unclassified Crossiella]|uniref:1,4-dihydroxy-2-naphthoate polyprenyltransferase n=1 Tax=unclassified Crossiella TaxID=2620835 RepID=UPI001FFE51F4|nr:MULTISPECIES: 1,4-dihydroxy-2-naphthoate polyprenyltransferase [unclassified Crossiella]MCK2236756.1 1,4-dihydroxy-2-naphthoate polyprenyltransferase [Crossiella sp. S99.2]MCK2250424.1 1,4-dihydroxy-2-naphthoate polyprenyltransferase [Crossiella sp. S99.1]
MPTVAQWVEGARLRTLPNAVAPVVVGTGAAYAVDGFNGLQAGLCLLVALSLVIGVNFANDYSDGIRGTDDNRVGPLRLVGSGAAQPKTVLRAALACFGLAAVTGLAIAVTSGNWWFIPVGAICIAAAWFYTGGKRPYGYAAMGEIAVFLFFGPVAVLGTLYIQAGEISGAGIGGAVGAGLFSASVLVSNNLRDIPSDRETGKRTLAVLLGDRDTRGLYTALVVVPFLLTTLVGFRQPWALLGFLAAPLVFFSLRRVLRGDTGMQLIPVLKDTALAMLVWSLGTGIGLTLG